MRLWTAVRATLQLIRLTVIGFLVSLRDNWSLGIFALVLSSILWVIITNEQNPPQTGTYTNPISVEPVNVPADLDVLKGIEPVSVRATAPLDMWQRLTPDTFRATVDLSGMDAGEHEAAVRVESRDGRVRVNDVFPAKVKVELDRLSRQTVPVQVHIQQPPPFGYTAQEPQLSVSKATVIGPEQLVKSVDAVVADINLSTSRADLQQSFRLTARTARGYDVDGVTVDPQAVTVDIPIIREINYQTLPVVPEIRGAPPAGYWLARATARTAAVLVTGPKEVLQSLSTLRTQPLDISNLTATVTRNVPIDLPAGVTALSASSVDVELQVRPQQGSVPLRVVARVDGLGTGRSIANPDALALAVVVSGEGPGLLDFGPDKVTAVIDLRGQGAGTYTVEPKVQVPAPFTVESVSPKTITVTVR